MQDIRIFRLKPEHAEALSLMLLSDRAHYSQYFTPFSYNASDLARRFAAAKQDRYWAIQCGDVLAGFFMLRGWDEGYERPSFGVYIAESHSGRGLATLALHYCMSWCRVNNIPALMLKVHPDNTFARQVYEREGFVFLDIDTRTGHHIMEKRWDKR